ncbi:hypothetical protein BpHYR1_051131 [Brachionus plicatilis]|uniref:Uncharacterized protein n=1 Tax=Brachionus plicatilis TaxID=10195 RepID=A0A3M7S0I7_BRAPC|nr:hypothetical protein BpHYR1_051131 [Brachionus plicatilis]
MYSNMIANLFRLEMDLSMVDEINVVLKIEFCILFIVSFRAEFLFLFFVPKFTMPLISIFWMIKLPKDSFYVFWIQLKKN